MGSPLPTAGAAATVLASLEHPGKLAHPTPAPGLHPDPVEGGRAAAGGDGPRVRVDENSAPADANASASDGSQAGAKAQELNPGSKKGGGATPGKAQQAAMRNGVSTGAADAGAGTADAPPSDHGPPSLLSQAERASLGSLPGTPPPVSESVHAGDGGGLDNLSESGMSEGKGGEAVRVCETFTVRVDRADVLVPDVRMTHPLVQVHVIGEESGSRLPRGTDSAPVNAPPVSSSLDAIEPLLTKPCNFRARGVFEPVWEESLEFGVPWANVVKPGVLLLFELLDYGGLNEAVQASKSNKEADGWFRIAWGFLKVAPTPDRSYSRRPLRLQLYKYPKSFLLSGVVQAATGAAWGRKQYPSTLYVSLVPALTPMISRSAALSGLGSMSGLDRAAGEDLLLGVHGSDEGGSRTLTGELDELASVTRHWPRLPGQKCKVPNKFTGALDCGDDGAFVVKWAPSGEYLAAAMGNDGHFPLRIYSYERKHVVDLVGHAKLVYELAWSPASEPGTGASLLLSASADGTAKLWRVGGSGSSAPGLLVNYQHTAFVYTAQFHPTAVAPPVVATGAFDWIVRLFNQTNGELLREIAGHTSTVNSIVFSRDGSHMFSGDGAGLVRVWTTRVTKSGAPALADVARLKTLDMKELADMPAGCAVNVLRMHPTQNRLLIHGRANTIVEIDLRWYKVLYKQEGFLNEEFEIKSDFSPCGNFVVSGSEDGSVYVWDVLQGGRIRQVFARLPFDAPVYSLDWHPFAHVLAFASYGGAQPLLLFGYDAAALPGAAELGASAAEAAEAARQNEVITSELDAQKSEIQRLIRTREELKAEQVGRILQGIMDEIALARQRNDMPKLDARRRRRLKSARKKQAIADARAHRKGRKLRFEDEAVSGEDSSDAYDESGEYETESSTKSATGRESGLDAKLAAELAAARTAEERVLARKFYNKTKDAVADRKLDAINSRLRAMAARDNDDVLHAANVSVSELSAAATKGDAARSAGLADVVARATSEGSGAPAQI
ncbi:jouberin [Thecamonas trahens ATCC 50062]|uniref:Jouberin n=1 Tax=Thecamonas trahens ATCC 50062 TaxID=461836 RepID=A0A0L0DK84_THETB|nr:jouberin [Thecamonas trahens ATCC 50062]KNC52471.1 jouberin [Thecamonas trahens ATCC 50062]|eukprot:XP_013755271.1 jouberin [Thecamonas trahens ATCC 50062]